MKPRAFRTASEYLVPISVYVALALFLSLAVVTQPMLAQTTPAQTTPAQASAAQTEPQAIGTIGAVRIFEQHCTSCHGAPGSRAPNRDTLRQFPPERILAALTTGAMAEIANQAGLTDLQKRAIALTVSGRPLGSGAGAASNMKNGCAAPSPLGDPSAAPAWNGWSPDSENARFQSTAAAGFTVDQLPKLRVRWAFGFPGATAMWTQPTVVGKHVFVSSDAGF